jgi:hypothetical protein
MEYFIIGCMVFFGVFIVFGIVGLFFICKSIIIDIFSNIKTVIKLWLKEWLI